jgi:RimJ/RimL family protein N-acetyltransferase
MIYGTHAALRTAETDDAPAFHKLYAEESPRAALLTRLREVVSPTVQEIAEVIIQADKSMAPFYVVEDREGVVRGFCALRAAQQARDATFYAELVLLFYQEEDFFTPLAEEVYGWLHQWAFIDRRYQKIIVHCLEGENALRRFLEAHHFECNGVQREILFTQGRWHNMEVFTLHAAAAAEALPRA